MQHIIDGFGYALLMTALVSPACWMGMKFFRLEGNFPPLFPIIFVFALYDLIFCSSVILGIPPLCFFIHKLCEMDLIDSFYMGLIIGGVKGVLFLLTLNFLFSF